MKNLIVILLVSVFFVGCLNSDPTDEAKKNLSVDTLAITTNTGKTAPQDISAAISDNTLRFQKDSTAPVMEVDMQKLAMDINDKVKFLSHAASFRVCQYVSRLWPDGVLRCYEVEYVKTGSTAKGALDIYSSLLGINPLKISIVSAGLRKETQLEDGWFEIKLVNGKIIHLQATESLFPKEFFMLRDKIAAGDKSQRKDFLVQKTLIEERLKTIPFKDNFVITVK